MADGQRLADVEIRMWRNSAITGTVVDEAGEPAVGVRVQAFPRWFVAGRKRYAAGRNRRHRRSRRLPAGQSPAGRLCRRRARHADDGADRSDGRVLRRSGRRRQRATHRGVARAECHRLRDRAGGSQFAFASGDQTFMLPPGTLSSQCREPTPGRWSTRRSSIPRPQASAKRAVVEVRSGDERGSIDLQLRPTPTARVSGTVVCPDGPASNVGVRLLRASADDLVTALDVATTLTTAQRRVYVSPRSRPASTSCTSSGRRANPSTPTTDTRVSVTPDGTRHDRRRRPAAGAAAASPPPVPLDATLYARLPLSVGEAEPRRRRRLTGRGPAGHGPRRVRRHRRQAVGHGAHRHPHQSRSRRRIAARRTDAGLPRRAAG